MNIGPPTRVGPQLLGADRVGVDEVILVERRIRGKGVERAPRNDVAGFAGDVRSGAGESINVEMVKSLCRHDARIRCCVLAQDIQFDF